jgi:predicted aspartyl protease
MSIALAGLTLSGCATLGAAPITVNAALQGAPGEDTQAPSGLDGYERLTVPVMINGEGPFDFVIDTGANRTVVSQEIAARLQLPRLGAANIHGVAGVDPAETVRVNLLQVGGVSASALAVVSLPRPRLGADGLLGVDVLRNRRVILDFIGKSVSIRSTGSRPTAPDALEMRRGDMRADEILRRPKVVVPAQYRFGQLIIFGADVSGRRVKAFLDSGSQSSVGNRELARSVLGKRPDPGRPRLQSPIYSATGQVAQGEVALMPLLKIGGLNITNLVTVFSDLHVFEIWDLLAKPSLLIGVDVLRMFAAVEINYRRAEVVFYLRDSRAGR